MSFGEIIEFVGKTIDGAGVLVIVVGIAYAAGGYATRRAGGLPSYRRGRQALGRAILLGLELIVAADIIRTVAVSPTFRSVGVLAVIVLVRTFLSFSLQVELDGRWPWQVRHDPTVDVRPPAT